MITDKTPLAADKAVASVDNLPNRADTTTFSPEFKGSMRGGHMFFHQKQRFRCSAIGPGGMESQTRIKELHIGNT
ncbi:hypothetical protein KFZ56_17575 [Virgibacillus sp. NKC19-3]|uniref:hypothetical protein n=1 Tax=Virgibacillus saliphilus TaxID=2831674 RepID=UPI001C9B2D6F|nr:hypothetical protein [Virgibacillus sp. NKC19-3]MBY7144832.1 hypothetical protein [Virgibacillus sp. NKC19-3]